MNEVELIDVILLGEKAVEESQNSVFLFTHEDVKYIKMFKRLLSLELGKLIRTQKLPQITCRQYGKPVKKYKHIEITLSMTCSVFIYIILCFATASAPKRFYKTTNVLYSGNNQYEITLDNRKLKTPNGGSFVVRSEPLAIAVAAEWNAQKEYIDRSTMHLVLMS